MDSSMGTKKNEERYAKRKEGNCFLKIFQEGNVGF
jgi:hypothetical protein